jgi:hypothetical protein
MPVLNACDFAYPPSNITIEEFYRRLRAAGILVVQRYLWRGGKGVTVRERLAAKAAGVHLVYGYEEYASGWRGGAAAGVQHAARAAAIADELGIPKGEPIYYAVDEDAKSLGMLDTAVAYVRAANRPDHPSRAYGQYAVAEAMRAPTFQTYAWSNGQVSKYCALYQWHNAQPLAGGEVDYGEIRDPVALGLIPPPVKDWFDMATPQDLADELAKALPAYFTSDDGRAAIAAGVRQAVANHPSEFRDAALGHLNEDSNGDRHTLAQFFTRIEGGNWVPFLDQDGNPQPLPSQAKKG